MEKVVFDKEYDGIDTVTASQLIDILKGLDGDCYVYIESDWCVPIVQVAQDEDILYIRGR